MADRQAIVAYCDERLCASDYQDAAINGLQIAGTEEIQRLAVAVSVSQATIAAAANWGADAMLTHHGLFWGSKPQPLTGILGQRVRSLIKHDINLLSYHLPLDGHPEIGNAALLARRCGYVAVGRFGAVAGRPLGAIGVANPAPTTTELLVRLHATLGRQPAPTGAVDPERRLTKVGFLTGSGSSMIEEVVSLGLEALVTGDLREPAMAEARELGIVVIAAGHEATERFGVQALAIEIEQRFGVQTRFIADPNPV